MPSKKPAKAETEEPEVEIQPSETKQPQPVEEVELNAETGQPVEAPKAPAEPSFSAEEFRKMQSRYEYQARQFERQQRELQQQLAQLRNPQPAQQSPAEKPAIEPGEIYGLSKEELNLLGQQDWTKPVQMLAERIAEKKAKEQVKAFYEEQMKQQQQQYQAQATQNILEREKAWVLEQNEALRDESSEEFREFYATYNRMVAEDPLLVSNPRAPRLVYREWAAERNSQEKASRPDPEKERLKRVAAGASPQGRPTQAPKTIKLTQEELDFCKEKGLSPSVYAQAKEANLKEGVTA